MSLGSHKLQMRLFFFFFPFCNYFPSHNHPISAIMDHVDQMQSNALSSHRSHLPATGTYQSNPTIQILCDFG